LTKSEEVINKAERELKNGLESFEERDYIGALKYFQESSVYSVKAVLLACGVDSSRQYGVGKLLIEYKNLFPKWFTDEIDEMAEVVDYLEKNKPKVVVFLVSMPMWYMYEYSLEEYEAFAKKIHPKIIKTVDSCIKLVQQRINKQEKEPS
jgi:HEPN domain-containing protein